MNTPLSRLMEKVLDTPSSRRDARRGHAKQALANGRGPGIGKTLQMPIRLRYFLPIALCFLGCSLEAPQEYGAACPPKGSGARDVPISYIVTGAGEQCAPGEDCFEESFETGICPPNHAECHVDTKQRYYCMTPCNNGIACDGACIDPNVSMLNCGAKGACTGTDPSADDFQGYTCKENENCQQGKCIATSCNDGEYLAQGACHAYDVDNCGKAGFRCAEKVSGWGAGKCVEGNCAVESCAPGYHLINTDTDSKPS